MKNPKVGNSYLDKEHDMIYYLTKINDKNEAVMKNYSGFQYVDLDMFWKIFQEI